MQRLLREASKVAAVAAICPLLISCSNPPSTSQLASPAVPMTASAGAGPAATTDANKPVSPMTMTMTMMTMASNAGTVATTQSMNTARTQATAGAGGTVSPGLGTAGSGGMALAAMSGSAGKTASAGTGAAGMAGAGTSGAAGSQLGAAGQAAAADSCKDVSVKVGDNMFDIASKNGQMYSYILSVPKSVDPTTRAPLIIHWHALSSDPEEARSVTSVDAKAEAAKALIVYPRSPDKAWDVGSCCTAIVGGAARDEEVFARELVKDIVSKACVDEKRIYTNGFSNGGMISQMLACKMGDVFAAAAPMGSTLTISPSDCQPKRPIPLIMINGTSDPLVGYDAPGLAGGIAFTEDTTFWAKQNGCTDQPEAYLSQGRAVCKHYKQCKAGVEVAYCAVEGMGHCVPGMKKESPSNCLTKDGIVLGMPNDDIDALQLSFDFMLRFSLP